VNVYQAIAAVMAELSKEGISKDRKNQQQGYAFRGIDDMYNALSPILAKNGLCVLPRVLARETIERQNKNGGALFYTTVEVEFDFVSAEDGSKHTVKTFGEAMDSGDKSTNKAMSAAYKYAVMQAFAIPTEGDNDADAQTHEVAPKATQKPVQPKQEKPKADNPFEDPAKPAGDPDAVVDDLCERIRVCRTGDDLDALRSAPEFLTAFKSLPPSHKAMIREAGKAREQGIAAGN
jgi:hypothetical protein